MGVESLDMQDSSNASLPNTGMKIMADNMREIDKLYACRDELKKLEKRYTALLNLFKLAIKTPALFEVIEKLYPQIKNSEEINIIELAKKE